MQDDAGFRAAIDAGMVARDPAHQREQMRAWLAGLLGAEGVDLTLDEPTDWSGWDPVLRRWTPA